MANTAQDIVNNALTSSDCGDMSSREALVIAYNAIENDVSTPTPRRTEALAVIKMILAHSK